jgi:hypothetical protein
MGPENRFIHRVHKHLPRGIYREKMHNAYRGGTPDVWYSGKGGDLWIEYKWATNKKGALVPNLSALQLDWLTKRQAEGRKVAVAVGSARGNVMLRAPVTWVDGLEPIPGLSDEAVANWIAVVCG